MDDVISKIGERPTTEDVFGSIELDYKLALNARTFESDPDHNTGGSGEPADARVAAHAH